MKNLFTTTECYIRQLHQTDTVEPLPAYKMLWVAKEVTPKYDLMPPAFLLKITGDKADT